MCLERDDFQNKLRKLRAEITELKAVVPTKQFTDGALRFADAATAKDKPVAQHMAMNPWKELESDNKCYKDLLDRLVNTVSLFRDSLVAMVTYGINARLSNSMSKSMQCHHWTCHYR